MQLGLKLPQQIERNLLGGVIFAFLAIMYVPLVWHWYDGWLHKNISIIHEYFSHGVIGLPFAAYIAWINRKLWKRLPDTTHPLGAVLLIIGGIFYLSGISDYVNLSFPIILAGLCLWLKGIPGIKLEAFPLLLVLLATPNQVPYLIEPYALPLQSFIAAVAGFILTLFGVPVRVEEINLFVNGQTVEVAPHCAGLKMLFTTLYVVLMVVYWTDAWRSRTKTIAYFASAVLISVTGNIIRNTLLTYFHGTGQKQAFEWLHDSWGGDFYSACTLGLLVLLITKIEDFFPTNLEDNENNQE